MKAHFLAVVLSTALLGTAVSAEEITEFILKEAKAAEEKIEEASRKAAEEAEAERRKAAEAKPSKPVIEPRGVS
jgi:hypothetical protein